MTPIESTFSLDVNSNFDWCVCLQTLLHILYILYLVHFFCDIEIAVTSLDRTFSSSSCISAILG